MIVTKIDQFHYIDGLKTFYASAEKLGFYIIPKKILIVGKTKEVIFQLKEKHEGSSQDYVIALYASEEGEYSIRITSRNWK